MVTCVDISEGTQLINKNISKRGTDAQVHVSECALKAGPPSFSPDHSHLHTQVRMLVCIPPHPRSLEDEPHGSN